MSGTAYIECLNGIWSVNLPACSKQDYNQVYNYITDNHQGRSVHMSEEPCKIQ
ncbi:hypothetical protein DPMN_122483 [Dreissena polymorpha]|uniref:Sushi domain-containing protein n=1 Tax=Dreissena polymorpha TaxID=45954 RepID=A0A9D4GP47_DREPO|nr:hypothetical protein DPMN_122483 [Dreissena polymorpha]